MNPYVILAAVVVWAATGVGAFWYGTGVGAAGEIAKQASVTQAIADTRKAALEGAANAIAQAQIQHTTIKGRVETIVRENVVYRDCKHTDDGLRDINQALTGRPGPDGDRPVPRVNSVN